MSKDSNLFRKTNIDRINSPEQLYKYLQVTNIGVWLILGSIILLLIGVIIWGVFGRIETTIDVATVVSKGVAVSYIPAEEIETVEKDMPITTSNDNEKIAKIDHSPIVVDESINKYVVHLGNLQDANFCYLAESTSTLPDGIYKSEITTEEISPIKFIIN